MNQMITRTIKHLPADVQDGIMIGQDGVIGGLFGVTLTGGKAGGEVVVCVQGVCEIQTAAALETGDDKFFEINGHGRAIPFVAGVRVGMPLVDGGGTVVSGRGPKVDVFVEGKKAEPILDPGLAADIETLADIAEDIEAVADGIIDERSLDITATAEATATTSTLALELQGPGGSPVAEECFVDVAILTAAKKPASEDAFRVTGGGGATLTSSAAQAQGGFTLAAGVGVVTVTDVVGTSTALVYARVTLLGASGKNSSVQDVPLQFAHGG